MDRERVIAKYRTMVETAHIGGYRLNPDRGFCMELVEGILVNQSRYGIEACPCRLVTGSAQENQDIVCPCNYRDEDLDEYGACFCALYVGAGYDPARQIPDRRPPRTIRQAAQEAAPVVPTIENLAYPVWRCDVCGYLCARQHPPGVCPICKADSERFSRFL